jgi:organic radical activating enzyme
VESEAPTANLVEIFSSFQGEGPHLGARTLFVRFGECDLRCRWCDSPGTWKRASTCRIESEAGKGAFDERPNPVAISHVVETARALGGRQHRFASLTGGEPLLQPEAVAATARALRDEGLAIYLETHGLAVEALDQVVAQIDVVSMDWKLASDVRRASDARGAVVEPFHAEHERFLKRAREDAEVFVKLVVTTRSEDAELDEVATRVARSAPEAVLVLQPVTPFGQVQERPDAASLQRWQQRCLAKHADVRVIPQTHPTLGAL